MRRYTIECVMEGTHLTEFLPCSTCLAQLREARVHDWVLEDVHFRHGHLCLTAAATTRTQIRLLLGERDEEERDWWWWTEGVCSKRGSEAATASSGSCCPSLLTVLTPDRVTYRAFGREASLRAYLLRDSGVQIASDRRSITAILIVLGVSSS